MKDGCFSGPFHMGCLDSHCNRQHPQPKEVYEKEDKADEERILQQEAEDARSQWVEQMTNLSKIATPLSRKITSMVVALVSVALAFEPLWSTVVADAPVLLLQ